MTKRISDTDRLHPAGSGTEGGITIKLDLAARFAAALLVRGFDPEEAVDQGWDAAAKLMARANGLETIHKARDDDEWHDGDVLTTPEAHRPAPDEVDIGGEAPPEATLLTTVAPSQYAGAAARDS